MTSDSVFLVLGGIIVGIFGVIIFAVWASKEESKDGTLCGVTSKAQVNLEALRRRGGWPNIAALVCVAMALLEFAMDADDANQELWVVTNGKPVRRVVIWGPPGAAHTDNVLDCKPDEERNSES